MPTDPDPSFGQLWSYSDPVLLSSTMHLILLFPESIGNSGGVWRVLRIDDGTATMLTTWGLWNSNDSHRRIDGYTYLEG